MFFLVKSLNKNIRFSKKFSIYTAKRLEMVEKALQSKEMVEKALQSKWHIDYVSIICIPDNRKIFMCKGSLEEDSK